MYDAEEVARIQAAHEEYAEAVGDRSATESERFATVSNHEIDALYTPSDVADLEYDSELGFPGEFPFTRGVYPTMYRGQRWTMRQFAGFGSAAATNERFQYLVENGQTGLSTAFDMPSLMGIDSDAELAMGEVGKEGVAVDTIRDMEILFDGLDLGDISTSFTINPSAPVVYAMYLALADRRGVPRESLRGTLQNDMLKEFIAQKEWVIPPEPSLRLVTDTIEFAATETPNFYPVSVSGYHIREAGSTAAQELAFTLADGFAYLEAALERGLDVDTVAPLLSYFFNSHNSLLEEVGKFRAARRLYARTMRDEYGASTKAAQRLKFHTQTAGQSLTAQQPLLNVVRVTIQALAGVLGGTQSLHTNSYDEALALPSEEAVRVALRTQQVIAEESGVADTIDPLGGSFAVEALTDEIEAEACEYLDEILELGDGSMRDGVLTGIREGYFQREIQDAAFEFQRRVESGEETVVGVNAYETDEEPSRHLLEVDERQTRARQTERLDDVKAERPEDAVDAALEALANAVVDGENTMPFIVDAVDAYATMGEVMAVFEAEFGPYQEPSI